MCVCVCVCVCGCVCVCVCVCVYILCILQNTGGAVLQPQNVSPLQPQLAGGSPQSGDQTKVNREGEEGDLGKRI